MRWLILVVSCFLMEMPAFGASGLAGVHFGQAPQTVVEKWSRQFTMIGKPEDPVGRAVYELKFSGKLVLNQATIAASFFLGRLFAVSATFDSSVTSPASRTFDELVVALTKQSGSPQFLSKPKALHSGVTTTRVPFVNQMPQDHYQQLDLQIRTGFWIPEARWKVSDGSVIRVLIQKGPSREEKPPELSPILIFSKEDILGS